MSRKTLDKKTGKYKAIYNNSILKFVKDNYMELSDRELALKLNVSRATITDWRVRRLGLLKMKGQRNIPYIQKVKSELSALQCYQYKGIMQDSVNKRIEFLKLTILNF